MASDRRSCSRVACASAFMRRVTSVHRLVKPSSPTGCSSSCSQPPSRRRKISGSRMSSRSEEHTSELQSLMRISYAVFCLKKKKNTKQEIENTNNSAKHITVEYNKHRICSKDHK